MPSRLKAMSHPLPLPLPFFSVPIFHEKIGLGRHDIFEMLI